MFTTALLLIGSATSVPLPTFPVRWSAHESTEVKQGVLKSKTSGMSYFDGPNKKEVYMKDKGSAGAWDVIISDYSNPKFPQGQEFHIKIYRKGPKNATLVRHCQEWCLPSTPTVCDMFDSLCQPPYVSKGKYIRTTNISFAGEPTLADEFSWPDGIGPIPINELTLWSKASQAVPLRMYRDILIAKNTNATTDYTEFKDVQEFDPALFSLGPEIDARACEGPLPSDTCQQSVRGMEL
jgi:hypothetical protein